MVRNRKQEIFLRNCAECFMHLSSVTTSTSLQTTTLLTVNFWATLQVICEKNYY